MSNYIAAIHLDITMGMGAGRCTELELSVLRREQQEISMQGKWAFIQKRLRTSGVNTCRRHMHTFF